MYTYHSMLRAAERTRYKGDTSLRFIENGVSRGKTADAFPPRERRYLTERGYGNCTAKAYNGFCFIVGEGGECVTLYALPEWFGKQRHYAGKELIRHPKRYAAYSAAGGFGTAFPGDADAA